MKRFLKYITLRFFAIIVVIILLDLLFTFSYTKSTTVRNKVDYIYLNSSAKFDHIFLGSSRVEYHVNTDIIDSVTQTKNLNLGMSGQNLSETFLTLKLLVKNNVSAKKYFIQVDEWDLIGFREKSFIGASYFMPYAHQSIIRDHLKQYNSDYIEDCYIPFYRYLNYGHKIGYRELTSKLIGKDLTFKFYLELNDTIQKDHTGYKFHGEYDDSLLKDIKNFAKENHLNIVFFVAPYYNLINEEPFQKFCKENELISYVDLVKPYYKFKDLDHLNKIGAREFTHHLINDLLTKNNQP